jgi:hypothetical protein
MTNIATLLTSLFWVAVLHASAAVACDIVPLTFPAKASRITQLQPELTWNGMPGQAYRVQIAAVLPESRVVWSMDTTTQNTHFRFPVPIPANVAAVKVLVSRDCPLSDAQDIYAQGPAFFVNVRDSCALAANSLRQEQGRLVWQAHPQATAYTLQVFSTQSDATGSIQTKLLSSQQVNEAHWTLPEALTSASRTVQSNSHAIVTVQAICQGLAGPVQVLAFNSNAP